MKFKHSAIAYNNDENKEWLESIGYKLIPTKDFPCAFIITSTDGTFTFIRAQNVVILGEINCIGNTPLFKAISAMRDGNDYMQWFTNGDDFELCRGIDFLMEDLTEGDLEDRKRFWHKVTIEELKQLFKK